MSTVKSSINSAASKVKEATTQAVSKPKTEKSQPINTKDSVKVSADVKDKSKTSAPLLKKDKSSDKIGSNNGNACVPGFKGTLDPKNSSFNGKATGNDLWKGALTSSSQESILENNGFVSGAKKSGETSFPPLNETKMEKPSAPLEEQDDKPNVVKESTSAASSILGDASSGHKKVTEDLDLPKGSLTDKTSTGLSVGSSALGLADNALGIAESLNNDDAFGVGEGVAGLGENATDLVSSVARTTEGSGVDKLLSRTGSVFGGVSGAIGLADSINKGDTGGIVENGLKTVEGGLGVVDAFRGTNVAKTSIGSIANGGTKAASSAASAGTKAASSAANAGTKAASTATKVAASGADDALAVGTKIVASGADDVASTALKAGSTVLKKAPLIGVAISAVEGGNTAISEAEKENGEIKDEDKAVIAGLGAAGGAAGALGGMAIGAAVGSVVPVAGTAIGAVVGGIAGFFLGDLGAKAGGELGEQIVGLNDNTGGGGGR